MDLVEWEQQLRKEQQQLLLSGSKAAPQDAPHRDARRQRVSPRAIHPLQEEQPPSAVAAAGGGVPTSPRKVVQQECLPLPPAVWNSPRPARSLKMGTSPKGEAKSVSFKEFPCFSGHSQPLGVCTEETLVFVDADGVVNVGIRDKANSAPVMLCDTNLERARMASCSTSYLVSQLARKPLDHGEEGTFSKYIAKDGSEIVPEFAARLSELFVLAGPRATIVLSSSWRKPSNEKRLVAFEAAIASHLGEDFGFDAMTGPGSDLPKSRLELIGLAVREFTANRDFEKSGPLKVLVLEDFAASSTAALRPHADSVHSAEEYLKKSSSMPDRTAVKLIHSYSEMTTERGDRFQVGTGLTQKMCCEAKRFLLGGPCSWCCQRIAAGDVQDGVCAL